MKHSFLLICSFGAIMACQRVDVSANEIAESAQVVNEAVEGSLPVCLSIQGHSFQTRSLSELLYESALINVELTVTGYDNSGVKTYSETYDLQPEGNVIVNVKPCSNVSFVIRSGPRDDSGYVYDLAGQTEYLYAEGNRAMQWSDLSAQNGPVVIVMKRLVNKVTVEKISVNWKNEKFKSKDLKLKRIYLADIPRMYWASTTGLTCMLYNSSYSGEKEKSKFYNFGGLTGEYKYSNYDEYFYPDQSRLDSQLVDEVDAVISQDSPYTTPHVFYAYLYLSESDYRKICNSSHVDEGYLSLYPETSTVVIETELDGQLMFYRYRLNIPSGEFRPINTHIIIRELTITELGSPTFDGAKTYQNTDFYVDDWTVADVSDPLECI